MFFSRIIALAKKRMLDIQLGEVCSGAIGVDVSRIRRCIRSKELPTELRSLANTQLSPKDAMNASLRDFDVLRLLKVIENFLEANANDDLGISIKYVLHRDLFTLLSIYWRYLEMEQGEQGKLIGASPEQYFAAALVRRFIESRQKN